MASSLAALHLLSWRWPHFHTLPQDDDGATALLRAARASRAAAVRLLLAAGASLDLQTLASNTAVSTRQALSPRPANLRQCTVQPPRLRGAGSVVPGPGGTCVSKRSQLTVCPAPRSSLIAHGGGRPGCSVAVLRMLLACGASTDIRNREGKVRPLRALLNRWVAHVPFSVRPGLRPALCAGRSGPGSFGDRAKRVLLVGGRRGETWHSLFWLQVAPPGNPCTAGDPPCSAQGAAIPPRLGARRAR